MAKAEQLHLHKMKITSNMPDEQADVMGIIGFTYLMNQKMTEAREKGKSGWHTEKITISYLKAKLKRALEKGKMVDVANYAMMVHNRRSEV